MTETYSAYARIQPIALTRLHALDAGVIKHLVLPGEQVHAGQALAVIGGAQAESLIDRRKGALRAVTVRLAADRRKLAEQLVSRQTVAEDEALLATARGQLRVARQSLTLRAPADGHVLAVNATNGEQVAAGQRILTLQTGRPWLSATYYGRTASVIRPGMTGTFRPTTGAAIRVRVVTTSAALSPDGGEKVGLLPVPGAKGNSGQSQSWRSGVWGKVAIHGATRSMIAVPTDALVIDRARWWVLVHTDHGDRRQQVIPGPTRGWTTFIASGLKSGDRVVIENAQLQFHRDISRHYLPPG